MTLFLETAQLHRISHLRRNKSALPRERGIYGLSSTFLRGLLLQMDVMSETVSTFCM